MDKKDIDTLNGLGILHIRDLLQYSPQQLVTIANFHSDFIKKTLKFLEEWGLKLKGAEISAMASHIVFFEETFSIPVERLKLSPQTVNALKSSKIKCFGELAGHKMSELLKMKSLDLMNLTEIVQALSAIRVRLKKES